ncbi:beta-methylarginine biosynthesis bifunctional aminotransferase [Paenibacillus sp. UNC496MF]|uniref:beta-methylarginine biosynthesis bifunctional aminotransferase n=1 Tax=Paenibacillus sp. UNC496MF TaxID=1502753 RepID=UPI0008EF28CE|nr:beta-methylarginine biosynthesis bifunctional aminotransferase [Paenibacillus sp. UNC496MF]SFJ92575.1 beta-methylarginine biosynthesis bifunctional aminotransferase [Paenibacillus sp. UNC496MF]
MQRITTSDSPFTLLQQRLKYVSLDPDQPWKVWVENVPQWDEPIALTKIDDSVFIHEYAPCEGYPFLLQAIHDREQRMYSVGLEHEQLLVTNGALHGLSLIFRSLYRPNAIALCQGPILGSIATILKKYGYRIEYFSSDNGTVDFERLALDCEREEVGLVYVNTPHNPTGDILSETTMAKLVQFVQDRAIPLVVDMIYDSITYDGLQTCSPLQFTADWTQLYTVNSMSKNYGSPGLRIGWIASDQKNIEAIAGFLEQECVSISGISQKRAQLLLEHGNTKLLKAISDRKQVVEELLARIEGISYEIPRGGTQFFVKIPVDDVDLFADYLLTRFKLAITTLSNYQGGSGSYIRVPIVYSLETTRIALALLEEGLVRFRAMSASAT